MPTTIGYTVDTLIDVAKGMDPNGRAARIIKMLSQRNDILTDMAWQEGNLPTGHRTTVETGLPTVAWRLLNQGVAKSKGTTAQVDVSCGILEARSEVDVDIASLYTDVSGYRLQKAGRFLEAMSIEMASTLFYGNSTIDTEEFTGLSPFYSATSAENGDNIILGGGAGADNSSIWLITWSPDTIFGIYPKGSEAGLKHEDLGIGDALDGSNNRFRAYMDRFQWKCGLVVADWRYAVRIPNIDRSALIAESSDADLLKLMAKATWRIPNLNMGRSAFYMNRTCAQYLDIQAKAAVSAGGQLSYDVVDGKPIMSFRGIPIRITDALTVAEDLVS